jgi:hypothetical protein
MGIMTIDLEYRGIVFKKNNLKWLSVKCEENNEIIGSENLNAFVSIDMSYQVYCDRKAFLNNREFRMDNDEKRVKQSQLSEWRSDV